VITGLDDYVRELAQQILDAASQDILDDMVADAPVESGELQESAYGPTNVGDLTNVVGFAAPQSDWTDKGAQPHPIVPVNAPFLRFFWDNGPRGAGVYSFLEVFHPGQVGTGWFSDKVLVWDDYVQQAAEALT
jgi:hypothetical protein